MNVTPTNLPEVLILEPKVFGDKRGFFLEFYNHRKFVAAGIDKTFVQDNHSLSTKGVLRGLHYQLGKPQAKLVRVIRGEVFDVAVDIRRGSPNFGKWTGEVLSAENKKMMYVPEGFAHGFYVLSDEAEFIYKCSDFYAPEEERGVIWNDCDIAIEWPVASGAEPVMSDKDMACKPLAQCAETDLPVYAG